MDPIFTPDREGVDAMSMQDFRQKFIRDICLLPAFGCLISTDASKLSDEYRQELISAFKRNGLTPPSTDTEFNEVARAVASRSVSLR